MAEVFEVDIKYDSKELYYYFKQLNTIFLEDAKVTYKNELDCFKGNTIRDLKKHLTETTGDVSEERKDLIAYPDINNKSISIILDQLKKFKTGEITFFKQNAGEDVPPHGDYPYRKNCLLMLPIYYKEFKPTSAITYYKNGGTYNIKKPVIMDVMKIHGVKNITDDRLMLHIELPEFTIDLMREKWLSQER
jgi:hypothetical protein